MKLALLDRDGVINRELGCYVTCAEELVLMPGAVSAIRKLNDAGIFIAIITNQGGVGRGLMTEEALHKVHTELTARVEAEGGKINKIYYAADHPEQPTHRRKPGTGMIEEALAHFGVKAHEAIMVGDSIVDIEAAHHAGCGKILVRTGKGQMLVDAGIPDVLDPVHVSDDILAAAGEILTRCA